VNIILKQIKHKSVTTPILLALVFFAPVLVQAKELSGFDIAARSDRSDRGFANSQVKLQMLLHNSAGEQSVRSLSLKTLEVQDEKVGDKSIIVFDAPADVNGTAIMSHTKILEADDQWLYLPALKRIKRISSVNKSGPFVGSEFAFEDLTASELNKYKYKLLGTELCGSLKCDMIERIPLYQYSGYTRQVVWIDRKYHQIRKIDYYERRGDLLKTLIINDYRMYSNKFWRAHNFVMTNHLTGKRTELLYSDYMFGTGLTDKQFQKSALRRNR